jgi:plasmid stabilization system protein ParE
MQVEITAEAERNLVDIALRIAADDTQNAVEFAARLRIACEGLSEFPERFSLVPRFEHLGIRHRVVGNYLIFYRVHGLQVLVLHVLHGAMDYGDLLGTE